MMKWYWMPIIGFSTIILLFVALSLSYNGSTNPTNYQWEFYGIVEGAEYIEGGFLDANQTIIKTDKGSIPILNFISVKKGDSLFTCGMHLRLGKQFLSNHGVIGLFNGKPGMPGSKKGCFGVCQPVKL